MRSVTARIGAVALAAAWALMAGASPASAGDQTLIPSTRTVQAGDQITLTGSGFAKCGYAGNALVTWDGTEAPQFTAELVLGGILKIVMPVPPSALGVTQVTVSCPGGIAASTEVDEVSLMPGRFVVQAGQDVTVTGAGFTQCLNSATNTEVQLSVDGRAEDVPDEADGVFQQPLTVPASARAGRELVTAQCADATAGDATSTALYVVNLDASVASVRQGGQMKVTGDGYLACGQLQLRLDQAGAPSWWTLDGSVGLADGFFSAQVTVPATAPPGRYSVEAWCLADRGVMAEAASIQVTVLRSLPSSSPRPSPSPAPSSPSDSSRPVTSGGTPSPSPSLTATPVPASDSRPWPPTALGAGAAVVLSLLVLAGRTMTRALTRRGRGWVRAHLRAVGRADREARPDVRRRPGPGALTLALEPHPDDHGIRKLEVTR